jgi:rhomboid family GlyGly-CTERM serine protease
MSGSWWQWFTWPLVHVSGYHLMMDLTGFLSVFVLLAAMSIRRRWSLVAGAVAGSVLLPLLISSTLATHGLAGLSGPAHGLMAAAALHCAVDARRQADQPSLWLFGTLLIGVLLKVAWELATGSVIFSFAHFGDVGTPIVSTHLGGIIGALLVYGVCATPGKRFGGRVP